MKVGDIWRVQIVWPNGSVHYFGTFDSKKSAVDWISAHAWLTVRPNIATMAPDNQFRGMVRGMSAAWRRPF